MYATLERTEAVIAEHDQQSLIVRVRHYLANDRVALAVVLLDGSGPFRGVIPIVVGRMARFPEAPEHVRQTIGSVEQTEQ